MVSRVEEKDPKDQELLNFAETTSKAFEGIIDKCPILVEALKNIPDKEIIEGLNNLK
jgi:hypothetical protein